jgi:multidrug efflux system outer membrane protein
LNWNHPKSLGTPAKRSRWQHPDSPHPRHPNHAVSSSAHRLATALACLTLLAGCTIGPKYQRPAPLGTNAVPAAFSTTSTNTADWSPAQPSAHLPKGDWWQVFNDAELNRLELLAATNNQQLAAANSRLAEARASANISRADLFPQASLDPSYTRQRASYNQPQSGHAARINPTYNTFSLALQAGWEPDLWGRIRSQVESAKAQVAATADDLEATRLSIQAELAVDYFSLRSLEAESDLVQRTIETYRLSLELTRNRRKGGVVSDLDVSQAETQLRTTESVLPALRLQRARLLHAIATLCGQPATAFTLPTGDTNAALTNTPALPATLPSELLERRPDIAAAERRMASANAQVGVAKTAFYPRFRLNGVAGLQSIDASSWFNAPSRFWSVGPSLDLPLFTGGRNRAQLALSRAAYDETVARYRGTVLGAFQEVEDQLAAQQLLGEQLESQSAALASSRHTLEIANNRYKSGLITYLEVATAQSAALNLERTVVQLRSQQRLAAVGLIRALGGGWKEQP